MEKLLSLILCFAMLLLMGCQSTEAQLGATEITVPATTAEPTTEPAMEPTTEPTTVPTEPPRPWLENVMMSDHVEYPNPLYVLGNKNVSRAKLESVTFLDTLADMPEDAWDVSEAQNGSVMAWVTEGYHLFIAGEGGVMAPVDCSNMFFCYNAKTIDFNGNFHMDNVENMSTMFMMSTMEELDLTGMDLSNVKRMDWCFSASVLKNVIMPDMDMPKLERVDYLFENNFNLDTVDLSGWNTPSLTNMEGMFCESRTVKEIDLSGWDTSDVTVMNDMFIRCDSLEKLDLGGWDTSNVTDMSGMFAYCFLTEIDLSQFDTSNVTNMKEMFRESHIETLDLRNFDTSKVTDMTKMIDCRQLKELNLGEWEVDSVKAYREFLPRNFKVNGEDWNVLFK